MQRPTQLLETGFQNLIQPALWEDQPPLLRYVVKLHHATRLHFDFRLELYGRLLSFAISDIRNCFVHTAAATRVGDHDPSYLLGERRIPPGQYGAGPMLIWDHGIYCSQAGTQDDIYRQLSDGCLEVDLHGVRLEGRHRISGRGSDWSIQRVSGVSPEQHELSVLSGKRLDEIGEQPRPLSHPLCMWLEWEHFYAHQSASPQVVMRDGRVFDINLAAKARGVSCGMLLQNVLPLIPDCQVREFVPSPARQKAWLDLLMLFTDAIQPHEPHCAAIDLSQHPDPCDIASKVVAKLASKPFGRLRYGVGPSVWIAQLASRQHLPFRYAIDAEAELAPQSVDCLLALSAQDRERLRAFGFESVGSVAEVSPIALRTLFGDAAHKIIRAAKGRLSDRVIPLYPPDTVTESIAFSSPINDSQSLQNVITLLTQRLCVRIAGRQTGLIVVTAELEDGTVRVLSRACKRTAYTADRIQAVLSYLAGQLESDCLDLIRITVQLTQLQRVRPVQQELASAISRANPDEVVASLNTSLGEKTVVLASQIEIPRRVHVLNTWKNATGWS